MITKVCRACPPLLPIPAVLAKLGPLDPESVTDLRPYLATVVSCRV